MTTDTPTAADLHRAAGIEKMAAALHSSSYPGTPVRWDRMVEESKAFFRNIATAALAAWEQHLKEQTND